MLNQLLTKNGITLMRIAKILMDFKPGDRIPKISELAEEMQSGRGTVQVALRRLEEQGAIRLESRGHQGTYLIEMDLTKMWQAAAFQTLAGAMPLPYSKRYEGLATGLYHVFEQINFPFQLAYMRGASSRVNSLENKRYDFVIVSHHAAQMAKKEGRKIEIALSFGIGSYLSAHSLLFANEKWREINDGMKVGIDSDSIDQRELTLKVCKGKEIQFVELPYTQILSALVTGKIDACVFNSDELKDRFMNIRQIPIPQSEQSANTEAVMVVREEDYSLFQNLLKLVDVSEVLKIQREVMEGNMYPRY